MSSKIVARKMNDILRFKSKALPFKGILWKPTYKDDYHLLIYLVRLPTVFDLKKKQKTRHFCIARNSHKKLNSREQRLNS